MDFYEYLEMQKSFNKKISNHLYEEFNLYLIEGVFSKIIECDNIFDKRLYVKRIINEIFEKDIRRNVKLDLLNI